jgi:hypothetical protein
MNLAYAATSGASLVLLGVFSMLLGLGCLGEYRTQLKERPLHVMAWDLLVFALQTGTSMGYLAGTLFLVGSVFILLGSIWTIMSFIAAFL